MKTATVKKEGEGAYTGHCQIEYLLTWRAGGFAGYCWVCGGIETYRSLNMRRYHQATNLRLYLSCIRVKFQISYLLEVCD